MNISEKSIGILDWCFNRYTDTFRSSRNRDINFGSLTEADLCRHEHYKTIRKSPRKIVRCKNCQVAFANERYDNQKARDTHQEDYWKPTDRFTEDGEIDHFTYLMPRALFFWALNYNCWKIPNKKALDIGTGIGLMVRYLNYLGFEAEGVELSDWAVKLAKEKFGLDSIRQGLVENMNYPENHFGLVSIVHVLEHLYNPYKTLGEAYRILAPGGKLYLEVPYSEKATKDYLVEDHFWFHNPFSLRYWLSCIGFRNILLGDGAGEPMLHNVPFIFLTADKLKD